MEVRFHRGSLSDSLQTLFKPQDYKDFLKHCSESFPNIDLDSIKSELYYNLPDTRVNWDRTYIITAIWPDGGRYPLGFSNEDISNLKK